MDLAEVEAMSARTIDVLDSVRTKLLEPEPRKTPPEFSSNTLATMMRVDKRFVTDNAARGDKFPEGISRGRGAPRMFSLEEAQRWIELTTDRPRRPEGKRGRILCTAVFKGGTGKTTTTLSLGQGLTLMGARKVLVIDADPQGSLTQLAGYAPEVEITDDDTVMPYLYGDQPDLRYAIKKTYWKNLDLIPANIGLYSADFFLPAKFSKDSSFKFWDCMRVGLLDLAKDYDAIIIDTPPSLNYLTFNFIYAADGLIQPVPPQSIDFASAAQFWRLIYDFFESIAEHDPNVAKKIYDFFVVVPSRVKPREISSMITGWMGKAFGEHLLNISIPESSAIDNLSFMLQTIYDHSKPVGSPEAHRKYKDRMDELVSFIDKRLMASWGLTYEEKLL